MNVFQLRERLVQEYGEFTRSFLTIADPRIGDFVKKELDEGLLWPEAMVQLNPAFEMAETVDELVNARVLHPLCQDIFRVKRHENPQGRPLHLYRHQAEAIRVAATGQSYVLTTGTGSGKSLAYLIPIVDRVLREGAGKGIKAIVVYPMNALANSQAGELEKFLCLGFPGGRGPVRFARYTGQEKRAEREAILQDPPDILLTNYVMLELILTRPFEGGLVQAARDLRFLVLDELHTYRGRQGSDVAMLVRRVREACNAQRLQCVGTSATLAGEGSPEEQRSEVAQVATLLFGTEVKPEAIILETLRRVTEEWDPSDANFRQDLQKRLLEGRVPKELDDFLKDPLARWMETVVGLARRGDRLVRAEPRPLKGAGGLAQELAKFTGVGEEQCVEAIQETLLLGHRIRHPDTGFPVFAFRLHQFFSKGDAVYASLEPADRRHVTTRAQQYVPGDRSRWLFPLAFCRECGQEYYTVRRREDSDGHLVEPREFYDVARDEGEPGYLYRNDAFPWPDEISQILERLPDEWLTPDGKLAKGRQRNLPRKLWINTSGGVGAQGTEFWFVAAPLQFCLRCGVSYDTRERTDAGKLVTLAVGGRASATTILAAETVRALRQDKSLPETARKLLSFTDNRQDASLQAGHFNDFLEVGILRSALYRAVSRAGSEGLRHHELTQQVFAALDLPLASYARDPEVLFTAREETDRAFRDVLGYRLYRDLKRGWRVLAPNLEQCGLLEIDYAGLDEVCLADDLWRGRHRALEAASAEERKKVCRVLLDLLRRELAIRVDYLEEEYQYQLKLRSNQHLREPWAIDEHERMEQASVAYARPSRKGDYRGHLYISARGGFGRYLRRSDTFGRGAGIRTLDAAQQVIEELLAVLRQGGLVTVVDDDPEAPGYQVPAAAFRWKAGDGTKPFHDPIRVATLPDRGLRVNEYFVDFYRTVAAEGVGIVSREHTAQVAAEERERREQEFREGKLPVLFCSPTMELGVDIAELNVVNLRNIPPTPANYAQRSGRAGRSGQPALVFSYCAAGSSHDQYFFRRPERMVAGQVRPPQLDLTNEDLVRAHVHAVWLAATGADLGSSLADILDLEGEEPSLRVKPSLWDRMTDVGVLARARERCVRLLARIPGLDGAEWYHPSWLDDVLRAAAHQFDRACDRWRSLYQAARQARDEQNRIIGDASRSQRERERAKRIRAEAESQLELLLAQMEDQRPYQSDFYSYRYFASEGFLPGYNFPRLPLSAFIPGRRNASGRDEFLSRPRFLAISEFGPRSIVYHEGSRYRINRVILPAKRTADGRLVTDDAKQCSRCGYLHPILAPPGPDLCERCRSPLPKPLGALFRLQNVSAVRQDRINSDEEERQRLGYEIRTAVRFAETGGRTRVRTADVWRNGQTLAHLAFSGAATIWRINLGWRRRANPALYGFLLDTERGYWARNEQDPGDRDDPMSKRSERVIPFVEDRRNALLFEPKGQMSAAEMATLGAALKKGIVLTYQLEEQELAVEPLPRPEVRHLLLFYEAAEGGAGVLRRVVAEPEALGRVARAALEACHFDPETGKDLRRAPRAKEDCEAACYDCLMSYSNQWDHPLLDRQLVRDYLLDLSRAELRASPTERSREAHLRGLLSLCQTELERRWLRWLDEEKLELPSRAQVFLTEAQARPDFVYEAQRAAVFIDGPVHGHADVAERDQRASERLEDLGYVVIRFAGDEADWAKVADRWPSVFGSRGEIS